MAAPLMDGQELSRSFSVRSGILGPRRELRAIDQVSLTLEAGQTYALVGESGSGKTTLGRLLLGLLPPTAGTVRYKGHNITSLTGDAWRSFRRQVQAIFQDTSASLNPRKTIADSIEVPLRYNLGLPAHEASERAAALLERVGLPPAIYLRRYPHELSGGQRQRVGIARAIASEPRFIVADEPVSALDVSVRAQVLALLRDLQHEREIAYLFITHDLGVVRAIAHYLYVMYLGRVVERGTPGAIFAAPAHPYTRALMAASPIPDPTRRPGDRPTLRGDIPSPLNPPSGCHFHPRCPFAQGVCRRESPPDRTFSDGVVAACHFAEDVRAQTAIEPSSGNKLLA